MWITQEDKWLSESESLHNAQLVANYLSSSVNPWSPNAISALCGNMRVESSINPNIWEYGYDHSTERGFGLVQWTPATKLITWANALTLDYKDGDTQLFRIDYEVDNNIQYISTTSFPLSFTEFRTSTGNIDYLTEAFTWNYERPNQQAGEDSMPERQAFANRCINELIFEGGYTPPAKRDYILFNRHLTNMRRRKR